MTDEAEVSDQVLTERLADTTRRIEDGERARIERDQLILEARRRGWKQGRIADAIDVSQQAISKRLRHLGKKPDDTNE